MIKLPFGWGLVKQKSYYYWVKEALKCKIPLKEEQTLHCGYKSCQFSTTDPKGLKIHRARVHRKKQ